MTQNRFQMDNIGLQPDNNLYLNQQMLQDICFDQDEPKDEFFMLDEVWDGQLRKWNSWPKVWQSKT